MTFITRKPKVFIGSSTEGKEIAKITKKLLELDGRIEAKVWTETFKIGQAFIESLSNALDQFDFAVLIMTADDFLISRESKHIIVRDNVLFELGLFMGRLGRERAFMLYDDTAKIKHPSDLRGVHAVRFSIGKYDNLSDALKRPCEIIRSRILELGILEVEIESFEVWKDSSQQIHGALEKATPKTRLRIIQTWFPDKEDFVIELKNLLVREGKRFEIQILLMNSENHTYDDHLDVLGGRMKLRDESRKIAIENIEATIEALIKMKNDVDEQWNLLEENEGLSLEIHQYDFLPFGPFYQIGDEVMFIGIYPNHCSSRHAPMLQIKSGAKKAWSLLDEHFEKGWKHSEIRYP